MHVLILLGGVIRHRSAIKFSKLFLDMYPQKFIIKQNCVSMQPFH